MLKGAYASNTFVVEEGEVSFRLSTKEYDINNLTYIDVISGGALTKEEKRIKDEREKKTDSKSRDVIEAMEAEQRVFTPVVYALWDSLKAVPKEDEQKREEIRKELQELYRRNRAYSAEYLTALNEASSNYGEGEAYEIAYVKDNVSLNGLILLFNRYNYNRMRKIDNAAILELLNGEYALKLKGEPMYHRIAEIIKSKESGQ